MPQWLAQIDSENINSNSFPLQDVLRYSLYYPSSGFDGDPVRHLGGNVLSFTYVDYSRPRADLIRELNDQSRGFRDYEIIAHLLLLFSLAMVLAVIGLTTKTKVKFFHESKDYYKKLAGPNIRVL